MSSPAADPGERTGLLETSRPSGRPPATPPRPLPYATGKSINDPRPPAPPQRGVIDEDDDDDDDLEDGGGGALLWAFLAMIVFALLNRIFGKLQTYPMYNYPFFSSLLSTFVYIPASFMYIFPVMYCTSRITKEQTSIPKYKFAVMGALDSIAGVMQTFSVNFITNASMIVLLQQSAIPISMLISRIFLGARYTPSQYCGAAVVVSGIVAVLLPSFGASPQQQPQDDDDGVVGSQATWSLVLVLSCVPMVFSSVYKEKALGDCDVDVVYLNGWVAIFQFIAALPMAFPSAAAMDIPMAGIPDNLWEGVRCLAGVNSVTAETATAQRPPDDCAWAPWVVSAYLVCNIVYNILMIVILKLGSASLLYLASTVIVPLSGMAFAMPFMPRHRPLRLSDVLGLCLIMLGLLVYRFFGPFHAFVAARVKQRQLTAAEEGARARAAKAAREAARRQARFLGVNQAESLQPMVDTRIYKEQRARLYRTTEQVRGSFLLRLGIPPSPQITVHGGGGRVTPTRSPASAAGVAGAGLGPKPTRSPAITRSPGAATAVAAAARGVAWPRGPDGV